MHIIINLHGFSPGSGGVETYLINLIEALQRVDKVNEFSLFGDRRLADNFPLHVPNFRYVEKDFTGHNWRGWARVVGQRYLRRDILARHLTSIPADLIHHPLTILNPMGLAVPGVLTFHDMQQEFHPEFFPVRELQQRGRHYLPSVREARAIIAISGYVKGNLVERYGVNPDKVHVVHHGLCTCFNTVTDNQKLVELTRKYSLDSPFMFYPAATWPHKNHLRLLRTVRVLVDRGLFNGELLLAGAAKQDDPVVRRTVIDYQLEKHVRFLGYLSTDDLPCLYKLAKLMVFPSLFEGFGLPVIEAMACGCPVACSNQAALPEIAGNAACYFDPESIDEMAHVIGTLWGDSLLKGEMRRRGLEQAKKYTWEKAATETIAVYQQAVAGN
jgi:glycosyltransferase involved in cell wall biosynthesis